MKRAALLTIVLAAASCTKYDPGKYVVGPDDTNTIDAILNLTIDPPSIQADGLTTATITVTMSPQSIKKEVVFTATDGTFTVGAQADPKTAKVTADASGKAVTELRSSTTVGTVNVDASVTFDANQPAIRRAKTIAFTVPSATGLITLASSAPTVPADGFSRVTITGTLKVSGGTTTQRQIQFKSTEGKLYAAGKTAETTQTIPVGVDGTAIVELESTKNVRDAHVIASISNVSQEIVVRQTAIDPTSIITVSASAPTAPADGATLTRILARISPALPEGRRTVSFAVVPSDIAAPPSATADASNQVLGDIKSGRTIGPVRVTATVDNTSAFTTVQLVPALPDRILLSAPSTTVAIGGNIVITATLQRDIGKVSEGLNVVFTPTDPFGGKAGDFAANSVTDANGVAQATFFPGVGASPGTVTITARVDGAAAVGTLRIVIQ